ncbi:AWPM-19-like protein [Corchorus olitorius]|uniref:AWPM-19-like protein n=1 Tax=Corchorus olitorius TaxID=93759 RepID=A0A1R3JIN9_9ROSI|nr:AWPM-19-like protein [Corchorus olitorius]
MATGNGGRSLMPPLLAVNIVVYFVILGLASWSVDKFINGEQNHPHLGGNPSTGFMLIFALIAGVTGACSVLAGLLHHLAWTSHSLAAAASLAIISWAVTALAFGVVCKEIILGGHRGKRLQTLEAFITISVVSQLLYVVLLHAGMFNTRYGPGYATSGNHGSSIAMAHQETRKTSTTVIAR